MDLANFLNSMGADIKGAGTDSIQHPAAWSASAAAPTASSPTRSRRAPIWPPWPPPADELLIQQHHPQAHGLHHRQAHGDGRDGGGAGRHHAGPPQRAAAAGQRQDPALPRLPHGYAAPDRGRAVSGSGHQPGHRGRHGTTASSMWTSCGAWAPSIQVDGKVAVIEGVDTAHRRAGAGLRSAGRCGAWSSPVWPLRATTELTLCPVYRAWLRGSGGQAPRRWARTSAVVDDARSRERGRGPHQLTGP